MPAFAARFRRRIAARNRRTHLVSLGQFRVPEYRPLLCAIWQWSNHVQRLAARQAEDHLSFHKESQQSLRARCERPGFLLAAGLCAHQTCGDVPSLPKAKRVACLTTAPANYGAWDQTTSTSLK